MKHPASASTAECIPKAEHSNSKDFISTLVEKQSYPICKPPVKRIVYHISSKTSSQIISEGH
jgi:hypothetical protein